MEKPLWSHRIPTLTKILIRWILVGVLFLGGCQGGRFFWDWKDPVDSGGTKVADEGGEIFKEILQPWVVGKRWTF